MSLRNSRALYAAHDGAIVSFGAFFQRDYRNGAYVPMTARAVRRPSTAALTMPPA